MTAIPQPLPAFYVERFAAAYRALIAEIRLAVDDAMRGGVPTAPSSADALEWQSRVLPLLESRYAAIEEALSKCKAGDAGPIIERAEDASGLSKNLDNFSLSFAGPEHEQDIKALVRQVVLAAYPVYSAAQK